VTETYHNVGIFQTSSDG